MSTYKIIAVIFWSEEFSFIDRMHKKKCKYVNEIVEYKKKLIFDW